MKNSAIVVTVHDFFKLLAEGNGEDWEKMDPVRKLRFNNAASRLEVDLMGLLGEPDKKMEEQPDRGPGFLARIEERGGKW
ncbi:MAG: hypothetical protein A2544_01415 [Candidatus Zambryskibacteria bacterium RIFOXYD2_FULL_43_10]|uniref:Uncharacterized protein n=1 Tax=Candidatus Zambryskibacteria bacterium RIFOXYD2_FULL_43_10 TaxID=1802782 RepID=A0A1G2V8E3_9BACT|nr:MAG: hypothetical protein A2544_01415 [Candidatus Zambryskibacteria bacterium RIFOXYD2_FULL_43_10]